MVDGGFVGGAVGKGLHWVGDQLYKGFVFIGDKIDLGGDIAADEFVGIFIAAAMIGIFITMAGNKKVGTKVSSISILIYVLLKVLF